MNSNKQITDVISEIKKHYINYIKAYDPELVLSHKNHLNILLRKLQTLVYETNNFLLIKNQDLSTNINKLFDLLNRLERTYTLSNKLKVITTINKINRIINRES